MNWTIIDGLVARGSYGKSFNAPQPSAYVPSSGRRILLQSRAIPNGGGATTAVAYINEGPATLDPQEATTYSFGIDFNPPGSGFAGGATYWHLEVPNAFGAPSLSSPTILNEANVYPGLITLNPTQAQLDALLVPPGRFCQDFTGGAPVPCTQFGYTANRITAIVDARNGNLAKVEAAGVDLEASYRFEPTSVGTFALGFTATRMTKYDLQATSASPTVDQLNQ